MAIAVGQFTIYDFHDVYSATTPPTNPQKNQVWLDTSATPPVMKTWNGTEWLVANDYVSGGTNLILNSRQVILNRSDNGNYDCSVAEKDYVKITPKNNGNVYGYVSTSKVRTKGVQYTISFEVMTPTKIGFYWYPSETYSKSNYIDSDSKWQKIQFTYTQTGEDNESTSLFGLQGLTAGSTYLLKNLQLETGNRASDWSQAPEDIEKELIRVESKVEVNADAILQKVSKTDYTGNTIVSMINQTAESVKISAKNIELNGAVTFSSFDSSTQSKITNIENTANNASSAANTAQQTANSAVDKIDNLEIGSRNYILNSNFATGNLYKWNTNYGTVTIVDDSLLRVKAARVVTTAASQGLFQTVSNSIALFESDYAASVFVKGTAGQVVKLSFESAITYSHTLSGDWDVIEVTMPRSKYGSWNKTITLYSGSAQTFYATKFLLTTGNKILDWMPAPEDTELEVTNAKNIANNAAQTATTAKSTADSASSTANTASSNASTALSTANTAKTTATNAQSTASTANTNATTAINTANNANSTASTANNTANTAKSTADSAKTKAEEADSKIENLEVGGRNYIMGSKEKIYVGNNTENQTKDLWKLTVNCAELNGKKAIASFDWEVTGTDSPSGRFRVQTGSNHWVSVVNNITVSGSNKKGKAVGVPFTINVGERTFTTLQIRMDNFVGTLKITNFKFEIGNKSTDWSPAPEDTELEINNAQNAASNAQQTANTANGNANSAISTANTAKSTADSASSTANTAKTTADSAKSTATTAQSTASQAQSAANTANTNATTAVNTANNAQNAANSANTAAGNAQNTANNAQSSANTANNKLDSWSYPTDKTTINGGKIMTGSVTAKQIAAQTITADKLRVGDFNNLVQIHPDLNPNGNAVFTSNGVNYFKIGQGGYAAIVLFRSFNLDFVQNDEYSFIYTGYKDSNITGVSLIARYFYTDSTWNNAGHANLSMENSVSTKTVTLKITAKPTAGKILKEIRFFMEKDNTTTGYYYLTDMQLYKKGKGSLIVDGSIEAKHLKAGAITADIITSGTFKGTNFEAGGSGVSGLILAKDDSDDITFSASKNGVFAKNITFVDTVNFDGTFTTSRKSVLNSNGLTYSKGESSSSYSSEDEVSIGASGVVVKNTYSSSGGSDSITSTTITNNSVATGTLTANGNVESKGFISSAGNITSQGGIFGTTFIQHSANYGTPLEVGQYIDLHSIGSKNDVDVRLDTGGTRDRLRISGGADLSRYVEIGMNSNGSFLRDSPSGKYIQLRTDRLTYDGATVPHNWRQNFTPFIFSDTGNFNMVESWGEAVYLGDLVWIRGRVRGSRGGHSGSVYIGGLPVSCIAGYPALDIAFFGGVTASLGNGGFDIRAYLEGNASHSIITYSNKDTGGWHNLQCSHVTTGNMDISFSATYRWR